MNDDLMDLKRTAYAVGELDATERAVIEAELASSPQRRAQVADMRSTARVVTGAFAVEQSPGLSELHHLAIESRIQQLSASESGAARRNLRDRLMFWVPTALAACAMIASGVTLMMFTLQHTENTHPRGGDNGTGNGVGISAKIGDAPARPAAIRPNLNDLVRAINQHRLDHPPVGTPTFRGPHVDTVNLTEGDSAHAFHAAGLTPLSAFPLTVDVASYDHVQRYLERGALPPKEAVHVEAIINAHHYDDAPQPTGDHSLAVRTEVSECPWNKEHRLARVLIKARGEGDGTEASGIAAEDVRVRVEFNPAKVASYRLIGYENRWPVEGANPADAPVEIHNGYTLTVLYEIVPAGARSLGDNFELTNGRLKYQKPAQFTHAANTDELFTVALRYRLPDEPLTMVAEAAALDLGGGLDQASPQFRFAAAAAQFGLLLIDSPAKGQSSFAAAYDLAWRVSDDADEKQAAMLEMIRKAEAVAVN